MQNLDSIFIHNLRFDAILGIYPEERSTPQPIIVNLRIDTDTRQSALSRNIDDTLDYATLANEVIEMAVGEEHLLIETLVQVIADHCLGHPLVLGVLVKVEKPQAVQSADSVGVQIYRQKDSAT